MQKTLELREKTCRKSAKGLYYLALKVFNKPFRRCSQVVSLICSEALHVGQNIKDKTGGGGGGGDSDDDDEDGKVLYRKPQTFQHESIIAAANISGLTNLIFAEWEQSPCSHRTQSNAKGQHKQGHLLLIGQHARSKRA